MLALPLGPALGAALIMLGLARLGGFCAGRRSGACVLALSLGAASAHLGVATYWPAIAICRSPEAGGALAPLLSAVAVWAFHCRGLLTATGAALLFRDAATARLAASGALVGSGVAAVLAA